MTHKWPLIRHEEHTQGDTRMVELYIEGEQGINVVQLDTTEYKVYCSIRSREWDDPMEQVVKSFVLPTRELSILITGDYYEEKDEEASPDLEEQRPPDTQEETQGDTEKGETQEE